MKKKNLIAAIILILISIELYSQNHIKITGKVKFPDNRFYMEVSKREGRDVIKIDSCKVKNDGTYELKIKINKPGIYTLSCQKWQNVNFWGENENLSIDFRGRDTAKIKIKNPPYVHIKGGALNEVMNLINWDSYRSYQLLIEISQTMYKIKNIDSEDKKIATQNFYNMLGKEGAARAKFIAKNYSGRNSILAVLNRLNFEENKELINEIIKKIEKRNPNYPPLLDYKKQLSETKYYKERLGLGKKAPNFIYPSIKKNQKYGPESFKGSFLIIDFWASWCGPCRQEIPNLKEIYKKYQKHNVNILSVSIDKKEKDWKKALNEEKMKWTQVLAPKGGKEVMKLYQFGGIPYIIILDKEGRIIAKNLRGEELINKIDELVFKKKSIPAIGM